MKSAERVGNMSQFHHSARMATMLILLFCLGLGFDQQALAGQDASDTTRQALRLYLPLQLHSYGYIEPFGLLDPDFDGDGVVFTEFGITVEDLAVQPDGKIVAVGLAQGLLCFDFGLARYNPDGSLDISFGDEGVMQTNIIYCDEARAVTLQPDGKIIITGFTEDELMSIKDLALVRYNPDGSLDISFGDDGIVTTDFFNHMDYGFDVVLQPDAKIIVAGSAWTSDENSDIALARYNPDGSLDMGFGSDGKVVTDVFNHSRDDTTAAVLQEDGKILVIATSSYLSLDAEVVQLTLVRYNPDGSLDTSFDADGLVSAEFDLGFRGESDILIQPDDKIMAATSFFASLNLDLLLVRFNPDGSLDETFGEAGVVTTDWGCHELLSGIDIQPNGKVIAAGTVWCNQNTAYIMARYNPDGSLDPDFGYQGKVLTELGFEEQAFALDLQADGKIILGGGRYALDNYGFTLVRYK